MHDENVATQMTVASKNHAQFLVEALESVAAKGSQAHILAGLVAEARAVLSQYRE